MLITCVSASNIKHARKYSTSVKLCNLIKEIINSKYQNTILVKIIPLVDYELKPCIGCGKCFKKDKCLDDNDFNTIYKQLKESDGLFVISPHYAPIPAKLTMLLEKMEQMAFLPRFHNEEDKPALYKKPVGIIGHGGGTEEIIKAYKGVVLDTIANALSWPIEMNIVGIDEEWPNGVVIPVSRITRDESSLFPVQEYDWKDIRRRIEPLVDNVVKEVKKSNKNPCSPR